MQDDLTELKRENRKLKKYLRELTKEVREQIKNLDTIMTEPTSFERGKKIAFCLDALEMANDSARYFGLGLDFRKDRKTR